ncbi:unnamed protein product (macronuclear) [Paramecium tetraurelia]|uniref:Tubulin alpha chain n=1 Tax=Paramecium tetraurelia TaxID=5888 RepID=A0DAZ7_PARTE|nr:uncharacterized protein GSPATT00015121001 [Paramecium tetraurelia]CAK80214.1 unnamed protein product [Paramecium tetraurelia]|eukprot:XP_001447611.1 hypothetical protein (macronuclear) [Paramecium tetraurelia strain d4-2]
MLNSVGGGTGSGFGALLLDKLSVDYCKKSILTVNIYPSQETFVSMVEPYNSILATQFLIDHADVCITMDNQAIYDICQNKLDIELPKYSNLNRIIAQVMSSITTSMRYDGALLRDMAELETSLVPYAKLKFLICSYAPIISHQKVDHMQLSTVEIAKLAFETTNMMAKCDPRLGKYISCLLLFRGDIIPKDVSSSIFQIRTHKTIRFVDWCPTGLKVGIDYQFQQTLPKDDIRKALRSACMIGNTTAVSQVFSDVCYKYDSMFAKRAFVHWYINEGMEEAQFVEAREELAFLQKDYEEADSAINEENQKENAGKTAQKQLLVNVIDQRVEIVYVENQQVLIDYSQFSHFKRQYIYNFHMHMNKSTKIPQQNKSITLFQKNKGDQTNKNQRSCLVTNQREY